MPTRLALSSLVLGGLLAAIPAHAQLAPHSPPVGGATGAISRPGWSSGQAPDSDFNRQGAPLTRTQIIRQRAAAARARAGQAPLSPERPARNRPAR